MSLELELTQFTGTEKYHSSTFGKLNLTDGMDYLRQKANCFWLIDLVESVQDLPKIKANSEFILWELTVADDFKWKVEAKTDTGEKPLYVQEGDYTDFPLKSIKFYQQGYVLLLPTEY